MPLQAYRLNGSIAMDALSVSAPTCNLDVARYTATSNLERRPDRMTVLTDTEPTVDLATSEIEEIHHTIRLTKQAAKSLDDEKSAIQISEAINAVLTLERQRKGWSIDYADQFSRFRRVGTGTSGYTYSVDLIVDCRPSKLRKTFAQEFDNIVASLDQRVQSPRIRWKVSYVDGEAYVPREIEAVRMDATEQVMYAPVEMPAAEDWYVAFDGMYGLDDYITVIKAALQAAIDSDWTKRINIVLAGPPACGKTDLCKRLKRLLGDEAVLEFDATSTTMAGAQQMLSEREEMPRVLIVEEIEKAPESSLQWLLSVLDLRGEIRKTTARGNILKEVHMIGIATVNNVDLFHRLAAGALTSRFPMELEFNRPTRDILYKILKREVDAVNGDAAWIEPTLQFAEKIGSTDPRKLTAICLTGRDLLVAGEYQKIMERTMRRSLADSSGPVMQPVASDPSANRYAF